MEISSAAYATLNPTELDNFKNPLRQPGDDGVMGVLDASEAPLRFTAQKESVEVVPGKISTLSLWAVKCTEAFEASSTPMSPSSPGRCSGFLKLSRLVGSNEA